MNLFVKVKNVFLYDRITRELCLNFFVVYGLLFRLEVCIVLFPEMIRKIINTYSHGQNFYRMS